MHLLRIFQRGVVEQERGIWICFFFNVHLDLVRSRTDGSNVLASPGLRNHQAASLFFIIIAREKRSLSINKCQRSCFDIFT